MARISGVNIPKDKRVVISLTYIYGIGNSLSAKILEAVNVSQETKVKDLTEEEVARIREYIEKLPTEGELRRTIQVNMQRLQNIGSNRGIRHRKGLPCRGQRTQSNARTKRGKKRTVAGKKVATK